MLQSGLAARGRIAYTSSEHDTFIYSVPRRGERTLTRRNAHIGDNFGARPSPLGDKIAYHSTQTGGVELWLYDVGGGPESRLTDNSVADLYADWSPDGRQLVFVSDQDGPFKMFVLDLETGMRRPLGDQPPSTHWSNIVNASIFARWSPDQEDPRIAFIVSGDENALWTIRPDGSDARRVMPNVYGFDWSLDSRRGIATRFGEDGRTEMVAVDLETDADKRRAATVFHAGRASSPGRLAQRSRSFPASRRTGPRARSSSKRGSSEAFEGSEPARHRLPDASQPTEEVSPRRPGPRNSSQGGLSASSIVRRRRRHRDLAQHRRRRIHHRHQQVGDRIIPNQFFAAERSVHQQHQHHNTDHRIASQRRTPLA